VTSTVAKRALRQATQHRSSRSNILITDDDPGIRSSLSTLLRCEGYEPLEAEDGDTALQIVREGRADVLLLDVVMPGMNGLDVLQSVRKLDADLPVIVLTGYGTPDMAATAGTHAVSGFLTKPFRNEEVSLGVRMALANARSAVDKTPSGTDPSCLLPGDIQAFRDLMGPSAAIQAVVSKVERVAPSNFTVVISGETGVGKELVAQAVHGLSSRASGPVVPIDCGAIPSTLIESELFGHEKGSFTGADRRHLGWFEAAAGGTLFFDEIGNLPMPMQVKLLRALQQRQIHRIGGTHSIELDVRVVAATNEKLGRLVESNAFRRDLFYRLNEFSIVIPPLRERPEDILFLAKRFLDWTCDELGRESCTMTREAVEALLQYRWPGNVRELRNVVRRAVLLAEGRIEPEQLQLGGNAHAAEPPGAQAAADGDEASLSDSSFKHLVQEHTAEVEKEILLRYLRQTQGNLKEAARILRMDYKTMRTKAKQYQLLPLRQDG
jgi:DNA-binding NtrC family response regulator